MVMTLPIEIGVVGIIMYVNPTCGEHDGVLRGEKGSADTRCEDGMVLLCSV